MLPKPCDENEKNIPENLYRLSEYFQQMHKRKTIVGNRVVCEEQKGFIKNINGCCQPSVKISYLISHALVNKRSLYIQYWTAEMHLDQCHISIEFQFKKTWSANGAQKLIIDSYKDSQVRIWSNEKASDLFFIRKEV
jgi:hypothetical protein